MRRGSRQIHADGSVFFGGSHQIQAACAFPWNSCWISMLDLRKRMIVQRRKRAQRSGRASNPDPIPADCQAIASDATCYV